MSPVSPVFHTVVTVRIGLKKTIRMGTSIPENKMSLFTFVWGTLVCEVIILSTIAYSSIHQLYIED